MRALKHLIYILIPFVLVGCAHNINIAPDHSELLNKNLTEVKNKNVALYIPADLINSVVTTPGGGGDRVSYKPYKDMEVGFYQILSNVFKNVIKIDNLDDENILIKNKIDYIIQPKLSTNSSSSSAFTWPPTLFTIEAIGDVSDKKGTLLFTKKGVGVGKASFSEFKYDHGLAGKRAATEALMSLQNALLSVEKY